MIIKKNAWCSYYTAHVERKMTWFVVATLKSYDHIQFDRTIDVANSTFEFFVPEELEAVFLKVMKQLEERGHISAFKKEQNRMQLLMQQ